VFIKNRLDPESPVLIDHIAAIYPKSNGVSHEWELWVEYSDSKDVADPVFGGTKGEVMLAMELLYDINYYPVSPSHAFEAINRWNRLHQTRKDELPEPMEEPNDAT
jgi:hypothetical protein